LSGCRLKHQADGYILGDIANVVYTPVCKTWEEFDQRELEIQELSIPEEVFALEMQLNLMGFYYRLARYPQWSPAVHCLATMIASEYAFREKIGCLGDYGVGTGETFPIAAGANKEDWSRVFKILGRRYKGHRPLTLWSDVFTLSIRFSTHTLVHVLLQPCYPEMNETNEETVEMRLWLITPQIMSSLNADLETFPNFHAGRYIIIPLFMYNHNPCVVQSRKSVIPDFEKLKRVPYQPCLFKELTNPDKVPFYRDTTEVNTEPARLFEANEEDPECQLDDTTLRKQLGELSAPTVPPLKKRNTEADYSGNDMWTQKQRTLNNTRVEVDVEISIGNPGYMFPDLEMPWNDRCLKEADPILRKWGDHVHHDKAENFVPDAAHVYDYDELKALAKDSIPSEKNRNRGN
jgi:hypothetical protein